jgi:exodeoxyribonuclease VII large subunit
VARPAPLFDDDGTLTVGEIGRRIERALRREFGTAAVWVRGELRDLKRAPSGHVHFNLAGDEQLVPVVLFASDRERVNRQLRASGPAIRMDDGIEVRIRVEVRWFAPRSRVSLRMVAIDPTFTIGRLAEDRERLLRRLDADGTLRAQARLELAAVPLRVGLVTSIGSAAHADVLRTFAAAALGFRVVECDSRVQGPGADQALAAALTAVAESGVDVVCIVRGGGARTDLAAFDSELLARAIAGTAVPVMTGIGHETDRSVADEVAWMRQPTPTACGAYLVSRVRVYCDRRDDLLRRALGSARVATGRAAEHLAAARGRIDGSARRHLHDAERTLDGAAAAAGSRARRALARCEVDLDHRRARAAVQDPDRLLARGWSITRTVAGELVTSPGQVGPGTELRTTTAGGELRSVTPTTEEP